MKMQINARITKNERNKIFHYLLENLPFSKNLENASTKALEYAKIMERTSIKKKYGVSEELAKKLSQYSRCRFWFVPDENDPYNNRSVFDFQASKIAFESATLVIQIDERMSTLIDDFHEALAENRESREKLQATLEGYSSSKKLLQDFPELSEIMQVASSCTSLVSVKHASEMHKMFNLITKVSP